MAGESAPALDATVAGASANTYATEAEATSYMASFFGADGDAWRAATVTRRRAALVAATRMIDSLKWKEYRWSDAYRSGTPQALAFPRTYQTDPANASVPDLPDDVKLATIEQAAYLLRISTAASSTGGIGELAASGVTSLKVGSFAASIDPAAAGSHDPMRRAGLSVHVASRLVRYLGLFGRVGGDGARANVYDPLNLARTE